MPEFIDICDRLRRQRGYDFEVVCNDYLKARYPNLTPLGISTETKWTVASDMDAVLRDGDGRIVACQYGGSEKDWRSKLDEDAAKVLAFSAEHGLPVARLIFCTTAAMEEAARLQAEQDAAASFGFDVEVCGLRRLAGDLAAHYPGIAARRLGLPIRLARFDTLDAYLDSPQPRRWPKRTDIEAGTLYYPEEEYFHAIAEALQRERWCLLTGRTAAGKTALAIAFGLWWRRNEESARNHPEAVGFYTEARLGDGPALGEEWYREMAAHHHPNELFIIDNCHLGPAAIDAFVSHWARRRPKDPMVLLVSRPKASQSSWDAEQGEYFDSFEPGRTLIEVAAERTYVGVLRAYSAAYAREERRDLTPVERDLEDPGLSSRLARRCRHNLAVASLLVEEWRTRGGRLADVTEAVILHC